MCGLASCWRTSAATDRLRRASRSGWADGATNQAAPEGAGHAGRGRVPAHRVPAGPCRPTNPMDPTPCCRPPSGGDVRPRGGRCKGDGGAEAFEPPDEAALDVLALEVVGGPSHAPRDGTGGVVFQPCSIARASASPTRLPSVWTASPQHDPLTTVAQTDADFAAWLECWQAKRAEAETQVEAALERIGDRADDGVAKLIAVDFHDALQRRPILDARFSARSPFATSPGSRRPAALHGGTPWMRTPTSWAPAARTGRSRLLTVRLR